MKLEFKYETKNVKGKQKQKIRKVKSEKWKMKSEM